MNVENWGNSPVPFLPGQVLSEHFYHQTVRPLIGRFFSGLPYTAALVGYGSDVLGFDTPRSRDHMWGPRLVLFLAPDQADQTAPALDEIFRRDLPAAFLGYPTNFSAPDHDNVRTMAGVEQGPVNHLIHITTIPEFIRQELGINLADRLEARTWLSLPQQKLLAVTGGAVYHDDLNFAAVRAQFNFYPHDVWLYTLACQWARIAQEEAFVGRAGEAGDELGSRIIAARLVRDLMRLAFLLERRYAPYSKWFGTAFQKLTLAPLLQPAFDRALGAADWQTRERHLAQAYEALAHRQNQLDITEPITVQTRPFFNRPFHVLFAGRFSEALQANIRDPWLQRLPLYGAIDQVSSNSEVLEDPTAWERLRFLYPPAG